MCLNCFTTTDAVVVQAVAGVALARGGITRLREQLNGTGAHERRRRAHEANSQFLASIGLDPDAVLGAAPVASAVPNAVSATPVVAAAPAPTPSRAGNGARWRALTPPPAAAGGVA